MCLCSMTVVLSGTVIRHLLHSDSKSGWTIECKVHLENLTVDETTKSFTTFYIILTSSAWLVYYMGWCSLSCLQKPSIRSYGYSVTYKHSLLFSFFLVWPFLPTLCRYRQVIVAPDHSHWHTHTHTYTNTLGRIPLDEEPAPAEASTWQHKIFIRESDSLDPGGIRTRKPKKQAAIDLSLRQRGLRDRLYSLLIVGK
jgi:hypothetical protein